MAEALLAAVILAMTVSAILTPYVAGAQNDLSNSRATLAVALAQDLMEEILSRPYADPDGQADAAGRTNFDDIADYHNYVEQPGQIKPLGQGVLNDPLAVDFSRRASVTPARVYGQAADEADCFYRIVVEVADGTETLITLTRLVYANSQEGL